MLKIPWISILRDELDLEYGGRPRIAQLATVDHLSRPRVRSIVCRRIEDTGVLIAATDGRSAKIQQVAENAFAEWAFWLGGRRKQFRLGGPTQLIAGSATGDQKAMREAVWRELSDAARGLFVWPASGTPRGSCDLEFVTGLASDSPIPASFNLIVTMVDEVEMLDLNPHPHERLRWRAESAWGVESVNP